MTANDEADIIQNVVERIQCRQIAFARHTEYFVNAVDAELIDQDLAASSFI